MQVGEGVGLPTDFSSAGERLSDEQLKQLRLWVLTTALQMSPGKQRTLLFLLAVTEETGTVWNRLTKAELSSGTGLSKSGVKSILRALKAQRLLRARETSGPRESHGVNEYSLPGEAYRTRKKSSRPGKTAAPKKAPDRVGEPQTVPAPL